MSKRPDGKSEQMMGKNGQLDANRLKSIRVALIEKRSEIRRHQSAQLNALYSPDKHHLADLEEMASDSTDTDSVCAIVDLGSSTMEQIDAALEKIDAGTFGVCEGCDKPIPYARIEVLPFAALCVNCQRAKELNGAAD